MALSAYACVVGSGLYERLKTSIQPSQCVSVVIIATANFAGQTLSDTVAFTSKPDSFEWCGGLYTYKDLAEALSLICNSDQSTSINSHIQQSSQNLCDSSYSPNLTSDTPLTVHDNLKQPPVSSASHSSVTPVSPLLPPAVGDIYGQRPCEGQLKTDQQLQHSSVSLSEQFCDPWMPDSWELLTKDAQELLIGLAAAEYVPWVSYTTHCILCGCSVCLQCVTCC